MGRAAKSASCRPTEFAAFGTNTGWKSNRPKPVSFGDPAKLQFEFPVLLPASALGHIVRLSALA